MSFKMNRFSKVCRKFKCKYNLRPPNPKLEPPNEKLNLIPEEHRTPKTPKTPSDILTSLLSKSRSSSQERTPTRLSIHENESPNVSSTRLPRFRLNLDLPEHDGDSTLSDKESLELENTISVDSVFFSDEDEEKRNKEEIKEDDGKGHSMNLRNNSLLVHVPQKELTSLNSYLEIPSSTFVKTNSLSPESLWIKDNEQSKDQCKVDLEIGEEITEETWKRDMCCIQIEDDSLTKTEFDTTYDSFSSQEMPTRIELPAISNLLQCSDSKIMTESRAISMPEMQIVVTSPQKKNLESIKNPKKETFIKIPKFCSWLVKSLLLWIKKGYKNIRKLITLVIATREVPSLVESELSKIVAVIKCENDRILAVLSEKVSSLSEEFIQIRSSTEAKLISLTNDMKEFQTSNEKIIQISNNISDANEKLLKINNEISAELKILQEKISEIKSVPVKVVASTLSSNIPPPPPLPNFGAPALYQPPSFGAPPPPPPPPLPSTPLFLKTKVDGVYKSKAGKNNKEADKKKTPFADRPPITVDDLLKVTLKKAPQKTKECRSNSLPGPRGPVISLDMLRNVKLRSSRRRSLDPHKSPRTSSRVIKNRSQSNLTNLSPVSRGSPESSLLKLLKPVDSNRKVFRRIRSVPSSREIDLNKRELPSPQFKSDSVSDSVFI